MFDVHSHILPGLDDGAPDLFVAVEMAKAYADQGVTCVACTPHILPGLYHNSGPQIRLAVVALSARLKDKGIALELVPGADNHMMPEFAPALRAGHLLALADSRYVLVEPPHHVAPARLVEWFFEVQLAGYVPVLTHPERLAWIEEKYATIRHLVEGGVWMQITSGSLRGGFGRRARYWAERLLSDGLVHVMASDAHNMGSRRPDLADGLAIAERVVGPEEARNLVLVRPRGIVLGLPPHELPNIAIWSPDDDARFDEGLREGHAPAPVGLAGRLRRLFA